ncbi:MAG: hypothetical protein CMM87_02110 [Rickettsiales bacterium]|nr:hypothetical protein [Rickettsiales bacterium]
MFYVKYLLLLLLGSLSTEAGLNIASVTSKIGYEFEDQTCLRQSFAVGTPEFRKLESLGDGVLYKTLTEYLYSNSQDAHEIHTQREKYKTNLALSKRFVGLGLVDDLNHVWQSPAGTNKSENYAATLEALIGAIQHDGGDVSSKNFIYRIFDFKTPKKGKRSKAVRAGEEQTAKKPKRKDTTIKINPKAPKLLSDILSLPQDEQIKKYGKKYLNHRYVELKRDAGLYAIEAFSCHFGGVASLELHRVEAESLAAAKAPLATWALEDLEVFSETSFYRGLAKSKLVGGTDFLENCSYSLDYLAQTNKKIQKEPSSEWLSKTYCRHRFKKVGEDIHILEAYPRGHPAYTKEMHRLKMADELEARLTLVEWMLDHLDLFMIDSRFSYEDEFLVSNGFVKTPSEN